MIFTKTKLKGCYIIQKEPIGDNRGFFERVFCKNDFKQVGFNKEIVQINRSFTEKIGTFRGLHYQKPPFSEIKIVSCLHGAITDIVVDIRKDSATFMQHLKVELSAQNNRMLFIPEGFAHGFQTLVDNTELLYFHTQFYNKKAEAALHINDPKLSIKLPLPISEISERDNKHRFIDNFEGI